jgi:hypothetical protein
MIYPTKKSPSLKTIIDSLFANPNLKIKTKKATTMNTIHKYITLFIFSLYFFSSCHQNNVAYNTPDQIEYINRWNVLLDSYNKTENAVKKDEFIEKCTQLFNEHKSFTNWKGQVKEINSYDEYAQLIVAQMINQEEQSSAEFHIKIYKSSPCFDLIKNLKINDDITFSGSIERESSITGRGKITEPELEINCTNINGINNSSNDEIETASSVDEINNTNELKSEDNKIQDLVNSKISNKYFFNEENGIYTVIKFEPVDNAPFGGMVLSQLKCDFAFSYEIIGNKIETKFIKSGCGRTSSDKTFYYDETNDYVYMDMNGQKFIFTENPQ